MSVASVITQLQTDYSNLSSSKSAIKSAIEGKGVTVPSDTKFSGMAAKIAAIETPDATIYSGTSAPASSLGSNGDIYIQL